MHLRSCCEEQATLPALSPSYRRCLKTSQHKQLLVAHTNRPTNLTPVPHVQPNCPETRALSTSSTEARKATDLNNEPQYGSIQGPEDAASESGYTCLIFLDVSWVWVLSLSVLSVNGSYHHLNTQPLPA